MGVPPSFRQRETPLPIVVYIGMALRHIQSMDQITGTYKLNLWLRMRWNDPRLRWTGDDYVNVTRNLGTDQDETVMVKVPEIITGITDPHYECPYLAVALLGYFGYSLNYLKIQGFSKGSIP